MAPVSFLCRLHSSWDTNISLFPNHGHHVMVIPEGNRILSSTAHFFFLYFYLTSHFPSFPQICPEDGGCVMQKPLYLPTIVHGVMTPGTTIFMLVRFSKLYQYSRHSGKSCPFSMIKDKNKHILGTVMSDSG
jgi:hypothetical protein